MTRPDSLSVPDSVRDAFAGSLLLPEDPGYESEHRKEDADAHAGEADDADDDQVNREQEHADVFVEVHGGIVPNGSAQCTPNLRGCRTRLLAAL